MNVQTNPDLYRFVYTFDQLCDTNRVRKIWGGENGQYRVELKEDANYQDVGIVHGEAFIKAGYALVGVHQHHTDGDSIDAYTFAEIDSVSEDPVPDHFMDDLHYDQASDEFTSLIEEGEDLR